MPDNSLGIEIGGSKLQFVVGDISGTIRNRTRCQVDTVAAAFGIRRLIQDNLPPLVQKWSVKSIGVGFGGPVDSSSGKICCSHQIQGWSDFHLGSWLGDLTGLPVWVENDANTATLGEATFGAGVGFDPVFYMTLGSGVGGGLVRNGSIYHGALPGEAEIGHLRLDRDGTTVESRCSGWAVDAMIRAQIEQGRSSILRDLIGANRGGEARFLGEAMRLGDLAAKEIFEGLTNDIAFALSHVTHLFHPEVIILGGGLSLMGEMLRAAVEGALRPQIMSVFAPGPTVRLANLAEDSVPVGALLLAQLAVGSAAH